MNNKENEELVPRSKSALTAAVDLAELVIGPIVCKHSIISCNPWLAS